MLAVIEVVCGYEDGVDGNVVDEDGDKKKEMMGAIGP